MVKTAFHCGFYLFWCSAKFAALYNLHSRFHEAQDLASFNTTMFDRSFLSFIFLLVSLCIFSSNRCRFAKTNVNCLFTVSQLVQFTHRSFPIQSPAAVSLSFTPLISSGSKETTFFKKNLVFQKPHLYPQSLCHNLSRAIPAGRQAAKRQGRKRSPG